MCMTGDKVNKKKELWRLRINAVLTQILTSILYSISTTAHLSSCHRFVTNPREENINGTSINKVEPGLGKSELFYSLVIGSLQFSSIIGGFLSAILIKWVPYWYQFIFFLCTHILGFVLYGTATQGWVLLPAMLLVGFFLGAEVTLGFNYATNMSVMYVELLKDSGETFDCDKTKAVEVRNFLYALHTVGYSTGFVIGTVVGVIFSHLPIEQYQSIAWFNIACGIALVILFIFLFRGESSWKGVSHCSSSHQCTKSKSDIKLGLKNKSDIKLGLLQIFILISLHILSFVEMIKWAYVNTLLNPVLSDSFGLSMGVSSYFYLGLAVPRILGAVLLIIIQKMKLNTQMIMVVGLLMSIAGYLLVSDWQAIPYDQCTEYSPFHHPELIRNGSIYAHSNGTQLFLPNTHSSLPISFITYSEIDLHFDDGEIFSTKTSNSLSLVCQKSTSCPHICNENRLSVGIISDSPPCLTLTGADNFFPKTGSIENPLTLSCTLQQQLLCVNIHNSNQYESTTVAHMPEKEIQSLPVLSDEVNDVASNSCMNALDGQCHWIPFSTITHKKCVDCPPICRGKHCTLLFTPFVLGMAILVLSNPFMWVPTIALATNQTPKSIQEIVIGTINCVNAIGQSFGPILMDLLYEGAQKRTFQSSILLASIHCIFLVEILVLNRKLGPNLNT